LDQEWLALSVTKRQGFYESGPPAWSWLDGRKPAAVVGRAILVYDISRDAQAHEQLAAMYASVGQPQGAAREAARAKWIQRGMPMSTSRPKLAQGEAQTR
jgi:hypothetical protein